MSTWKIEKLWITSSDDVVTDVNWACYGKNTLRGKTTLGPPGKPFVNYADLTEDKVLSWVWEQVGKEFVEKDVDRAVLEAPAVATKPLPWVE